MQIIEVTWGMAFRVWWSVFWRSVVFILLASIGIGFLFGFIGAMLGMPPTGGVLLLIQLLGFLAGVGISVWIFKKILYKRYSGFSVVCIANEPVQDER